jgi:hypothetical protein
MLKDGAAAMREELLHVMQQMEENVVAQVSATVAGMVEEKSAALASLRNEMAERKRLHNQVLHCTSCATSSSSEMCVCIFVCILHAPHPRLETRLHNQVLHLMRHIPVFGFAYTHTHIHTHPGAGPQGQHPGLLPCATPLAGEQSRPDLCFRHGDGVRGVGKVTPLLL